MRFLQDRKHFLNSLFYPALIVIVMILIKVFENAFNHHLTYLGVLPLKVKGLLGILTYPFIHSDYQHLLSNIVPLFVLWSGLFYFYKGNAFKISLLIYFLPGIWLWFFARGNAYHIGASGVVYALASFHFFSGIIRKQKQLLAFALVVIFSYGSLIWGIFPDFFPNKNISWEGHLLGGIAGLVLAIYFRKTGLQKVKKDWAENDPEWEERIKKAHGGLSQEEYEEMMEYFKQKKDS